MGEMYRLELGSRARLGFFEVLKSEYWIREANDWNGSGPALCPALGIFGGSSPMLWKNYFRAA